MNKKPIALIIMDGFAYDVPNEGNAILKANIPNFRKYEENYPHTSLGASGLSVGLPDGQMGNSEVGHLNIGAGRVVYQSLTRINKSIVDGDFYEVKAFLDAINHVKEKGSKLHLLGLLSDGGVHSHIEHTIALLELAKKQGLKEVYVHAILDGRDVPPKSALTYVNKLENAMKEIGIGKIATVSGRFYAMDRDNIWERIQTAYDAIAFGKGPKFDSATEGIEASYAEDVLDEFVVPFVITSNGSVLSNDAMICTNFRPDRAIQISTAFTNPEVAGCETKNGPTNVKFVSMMHYAEQVKAEVAFGLQKLDNILGDVLSKNDKTQLRIAETQKYAHVTFFFDGGVDREIEGATRVLVDSPKIETFDMMPEMSAYEVTEKVIAELDKNIHDVIILNFANCDMVGHTAVIDATIKAVEVVDECLGKVVDKVLSLGGTALITSDHGNAEKLLDEDGKPFSAHTSNPVPFIITKEKLQLRTDGVLGDIAPTILDLLDVEKPEQMTGTSIIK